MFKTTPIPPSFSLIRKGKVSLLIREGYKDLLIRQGIEDIEAFLLKNKQSARYLEGRALHPCVPVKENEWMVVRRYLHGGWLRGLTRDFYLFGSRSFRELALTEEIRSCGIPTVEPLGAIHRRVFPFFYRAYLLSLEVAPAKDLVRYLSDIGGPASGKTLSMKRNVIRSAGLLLSRFHHKGFVHGDLQLKNFLVSGEQLFLIDFDRSCRKERLSTGRKIRNLLRLNRSAEKWKQQGVIITRGDRWRFFLAYAGDDLRTREVMVRALRRHRFSAFLHRLGWRIKGY